MVKINMQYFGGNGASSGKKSGGGARATGAAKGSEFAVDISKKRWYTGNYNIGMTEQEFYDRIDEANSYGDESLFPRIQGGGGAYVYEGSGGELFIYDPKYQPGDFSEVARINKKQLKFKK